MDGTWQNHHSTTEPQQTTHKYDHEVARSEIANSITIAKKQHELWRCFGQRLSKDHRQGPQHWLQETIGNERKPS
jgi:hypothetical protein